MSNKQSQESYLTIYQDLKGTIKYHKEILFGGYIVFRFLQFSVPLLAAILTSLISTQVLHNQGVTNTDTIVENKVNTEKIEKNKASTEENEDNKASTEKDNTSLILTMSIILTVVGTLNSILKPAESAEWAGNYSNKFEEFENNFNLSMIEIRARSDATDADYIQLLKTVNHDLAKLVHERNQKQTSIFKAPVVPEPEPEVADEIPIVATNKIQGNG